MYSFFAGCAQLQKYPETMCLETFETQLLQIGEKINLQVPDRFLSECPSAVTFELRWEVRLDQSTSFHAPLCVILFRLGSGIWLSMHEADS